MKRGQALRIAAAQAQANQYKVSLAKARARNDRSGNIKRLEEKLARAERILDEARRASE